VNKLDFDSLKLKAAVEFGSEYTYKIKNGGLGLTLYIDATTKEAAHTARSKAPINWEGLYVIVVYSSASSEPDDLVYDPKLA